jgi:hypothetical protein
MDGVLADFMKEYRAYAKDEMNDRRKFAQSVMDHKIFEKLDKMPDTDVLLNYVAKLEDVNVEILTSMGTFDAVRGAEAANQKQKWLTAHGINYKANFVRSKEEKAKFATPTSILIDDSVGCIEPFVKKGGIGILHTSASDSIQKLYVAVLQTKTIESIRA